MREKFKYARRVSVGPPGVPDELYDILFQAECWRHDVPGAVCPTVDDLLPFAEYTEATYNAGVAYDLGHGTAPDHVQAFKCYQQAAQWGSPKAMFNCGVCFERGEGVQKNTDKAMECYVAAIQMYAEMAEEA